MLGLREAATRTLDRTAPARDRDKPRSQNLIRSANSGSATVNLYVV